jgi:hypothetical protein
MANPAGESKDEALKLDFDRRVSISHIRQSRRPHRGVEEFIPLRAATCG